MPLVDKPALSANQLSAVDPNLLERVKEIIKDAVTYSSDRLVDEPSFSPSSSYRFSQEKRLPSPATYSRNSVSHLSNSVSSQEQVQNDNLSLLDIHNKFSKNGSYDIGPGRSLPAFDHVKPENVANKCLDGWLPAPSGLKREGIAERVTGQNCPQSLNERKSVGEGIQLKNLYHTGFDVEGSRNPRVQSCDDSSSTADKPPCFILCSVKEFCRHWSETQRLEHQKAEGNSTSGEMRLPLSHSEGSLAVRPSRCSPLAEGINNSLGVRQQRFDVALPASGDDRCIFNSSYQAERPKSRPADLEYYAVSRTVRQDESDPSKSSALLSIEQYRSRNVACSAAVDLGAGRILRDCKGTESETFERTWTFSKATSENLHSSGYDSTDLTGSRVRESSFDGRNLPNEAIVPSGKGFHTEDNRTETMTRQHSNRQIVHDRDVQFFKRVDPAQKIDPVEARERSRVEFGEEMIRRAQTGLPKLEDPVRSGKMRSESQPGLPIYKDYNHCSWKLEKSDSDRKLSVEHGQLSKGVHATGLSYIEDRREMSNQDYERKSEDRSRLKKSKAVTDEFMRTKFLLEIERREKELWRLADYSCSPSNTVITSSHTRFAVSPFEDEQITWPAKHKPKEPSCDSIRLQAPNVALKNYKSEMVSSHSVKPSSDGVASPCMLRDEPARRDYITRDVHEDRSRKADENTYVEVRDFSQRQPSGYRKAEPRKVTSENSMDVRQNALTNEFCKRNTKEPCRLGERHSSATRDSSVTDRTSSSAGDKPIPQAEIKDGFLNEERIAFWENLKAHLGDLFLKKQSPVTLQQLCSENKISSQCKDGGTLKEGKIPEKKTTEMLDQLPVKRLATVQPPKERSLKRNEEAGNDGAQVKDQLPRKSEPTLRPRQTHTSNQSQTPRCQDKMERNDTSKQKTASLRSSEAVRKTDSEQKLKLKSPEVGEKPASDKNQAGKKRKILNTNVKKTIGKQSLAKTGKQAVGDDFRCLETNQENNVFKGARKPRDLRNLLNSRPRHENWRRREIKCQKGECSVFLKNDSVCEEEEDEEEELVVEVPGPRSGHAGDDTSVEIFDSGRRREIEELTGERRNANKRRVPEQVREETDSEFHGKRFRFNRMTPARFMRGGYRDRGRRTFGQCSKDDGFKYRRFDGSVSYQGDFLDQSSDIVFDDFDCGSEQGPYLNTGLDHRPGHGEHWENAVEREYFQGDESDGRLRYLGRSMDRYSNPRDQHPNDEPNVQFEGDYTYRFSDDVDTRFDEEYRDNDAKKFHRGNYESCGLSEDYRRIREARRGRERYSNSKSKRFNKEVYNAYSNDDIQNCNREDCDDRYINDYARKRSCEKNIAPISDNDTEEHYRENRNIRYSSDNADEHFCVEGTADYSDDDVRGQLEGSQFVRRATYSGRPRKGSAEPRDMRAGEFEKLKEPKAFLKDLEQKELPEELAVGLKVTPEDDFYEDDYSWDRTDPGCKGEIAGDSDFADSRAWIDSRESDYEREYHESVLLSPREDLYTRAKFGRPSSGNSFPTRPWKQKFLNKTVQWQPRFGYRRKFGFQPLQKKLVSPRKFQPKHKKLVSPQKFQPTRKKLVSPKKFQPMRKKLVSPQKFLRTPIPQFAGKSGRNIPQVSNSVQEAIKQVVANLKNAEMVDPEADAALFDTLSRGERKQVTEIQQMTGIQCISAIVTAMRTLWEFEPNVVRTLGSLEPEEIKKLGDDG